MRRQRVDPGAEVGALTPELGQAARAVEERVQVDVAGAREAGADVAADAIGTTVADGLGGLGRRVGGEAADQDADRSVELVDLIDRLLGAVADVGEGLAVERVADGRNIREVAPAVADSREVAVEVMTAAWMAATFAAMAAAIRPGTLRTGSWLELPVRGVMSMTDEDTSPVYPTTLSSTAWCAWAALPRSPEIAFGSVISASLAVRAV